MSETELPVAEQFFSLQGEGPHAGVPAVFLRLAGCNLCCGGWENKDRDPEDMQAEGDASWYCIAEGEQVWLADGSQKPIEDVSVGDEVVTKPKGYQNSLGSDEVVKVGSKGVEEVYEIKLNNGRSVRATEDHEFYRRSSGTGHERAKVSELSRHDRIQTVGKLTEEVKKTEEWYRGWLKGFVAGDGYIENGGNAEGQAVHRPLIQVTSVDEELMDAFVEACEICLDYSPNVTEAHVTRSGKQSYRVSSGFNGLAKLLQTNTETTFDSTLEERGWLAGFFDAEGHSSETAFFFSQNSGKELDTLLRLLEKHGFEYRIGGDECRQVHLKKNQAKTFYLEYGPVLKRKFEWIEQRLWDVIVKDVSAVGEKEVYDLETAESKRFVVNGILTKNCDTVDVWREADSTYTGEELVNEWQQRGWAESVDNGAHIVLTGGEPTLPGSQKAFLSFYAAWLKEGYDAPYVEVETNGTIEPQPAFDKYVNQYNVSLKLSNSGMSRDERINPDALDHYAHQAIDDMAVFKFVVGSEDDLEEILSIVEEFDLPRDSIMLMPAGQTKKQLAETYPLVAEMCKERGWRFSPRLHIHTWGQATGV